MIRAEPDGYTIGLGSSSSLAYQPLEMKGLVWKSANDYQSIAKLSDLPAILAVPADCALEDLRRVHGRGQGQSAQAEGFGVGAALGQRHQRSSSSTSCPALRIVTVPFTGGGGEATLAALGGRVDGTCGYAPGMKGQIDAGKLRVLAVFQQGKYDLLPGRQADRRDAVEGYVSGRLLRDRAERTAEAGARQTDGGVEDHRRERRVQELPESQRLHLGSQDSATT